MDDNMLLLNRNDPWGRSIFTNGELATFDIAKSNFVKDQIIMEITAHKMDNLYQLTSEISVIRSKVYNENIYIYIDAVYSLTNIKYEYCPQRYLYHHPEFTVFNMKYKNIDYFIRFHTFSFIDISYLILKNKLQSVNEDT